MNKTALIKKLKANINLITKQPGFNKKDSPIFKKGNNTGILIIPGFNDTAFIMKEYTEFLAENGYTVYTLTLPGRGISLKKFAETTWMDWVNNALENYLIFKKSVKNVFISGFSTGATIALYLSEILKKKYLPDGLILHSPAIFFINKYFPLPLEIILMKIFTFFNPFPKKLKNRNLIFRDPSARKKYDRQRKSSSKAIIELMKMVKIVKSNIGKVATPFLVICSKKDIVVSPYGAKWLLKKRPYIIKNSLILKKSGHPVMVDLEKHRVFEESNNFIKKIV